MLRRRVRPTTLAGVARRTRDIVTRPFRLAGYAAQEPRRHRGTPFGDRAANEKDRTWTVRCTSTEPAARNVRTTAHAPTRTQGRHPPGAHRGSRHAETPMRIATRTVGRDRPDRREEIDSAHLNNPMPRRGAREVPVPPFAGESPPKPPRAGDRTDAALATSHRLLACYQARRACHCNGAQGDVSGGLPP